MAYIRRLLSRLRQEKIKKKKQQAQYKTTRVIATYHYPAIPSYQYSGIVE
jgi:hypothetical protein